MLLSVKWGDSGDHPLAIWLRRICLWRLSIVDERINPPPPSSVCMKSDCERDGPPHTAKSVFRIVPIATRFTLHQFSRFHWHTTFCSYYPPPKSINGVETISRSFLKVLASTKFAISFSFFFFRVSSLCTALLMRSKGIRRTKFEFFCNLIKKNI